MFPLSHAVIAGNASIVETLLSTPTLTTADAVLEADSLVPLAPAHLQVRMREFFKGRVK